MGIAIMVFAATSSHGAPTVLVELFTSEGCSSCPPADVLLGDVGESEDVAILAWHVEYWDYIGWKDPFVHAKATPRQRAYAARLARGRVYTPQMVVNGSAEFVGSNRVLAERAVKSAHKSGGRVRAELSGAVKGGAAELRIRLTEISGEPFSHAPDVYLAITEDDLESTVTRGENAGRVLRHDGVVRAFVRVGPFSEGEIETAVTVELDKSWVRGNLKAVVWVQDARTLVVFGVGTLPLLDR